MGNGVQVDLNGPLLAFGVDFEYLILGLEDLQDGSFVVPAEDGKQRNEGVVVDLMAGIDKVAVHFLEIWLDDCRFAVGLLLASFSRLHLVTTNAMRGNELFPQKFILIYEYPSTLTFLLHYPFPSRSLDSTSHLHPMFNLRNESKPTY